MGHVTVFVGGSVGSKPYADQTWSGSSASLLAAMQSRGLLAHAFGVRLSPIQKYLLMLRNFRPRRDAWRHHFYADPAYCRALTRAAAHCDAHSTVLLQIGSMFSLPAAFPGRKCVSYHDGNLAVRLRSGFNLQGISARRIGQALRYEETVSQQMTAIFTFSEYLRQSFILDYHVAPEKVFNIGGGINLKHIPDADPSKQYALPQLLFIGSEFVRKGGPQMLEAFRIVRAALPAAELHIVGPRELPGTTPPGVIFHGHLSKSDPAQAAQLESLFRQSTLFVLPSLYEPFGIAPLEAMLYQLPCVVTGEWALAESVTDGVNGALVAKGSVPELAAAILRLLGEPERLAVMGNAGRERVLARYTWASVVDRMAAIMATL